MFSLSLDVTYLETSGGALASDVVLSSVILGHSHTSETLGLTSLKHQYL